MKINDNDGVIFKLSPYPSFLVQLLLDVTVKN